MKNTESHPQTERIKAAIETVKSRLFKDDFPDNKQLVRICRDYDIRLVDSGGDPHLVHEILETSLNLYLSEAEWLKPLDIKNKHEIIARLENLTLSTKVDNFQVRNYRFAMGENLYPGLFSAI